MTEVTILVVGDIVTDIVAVYSGQIAAGSDTVARISVAGGGSAANTAAWLARLGRRTELVAVAGTDAAGTERIAELRALGVDCTWVRRIGAAATGTIIVLVRDGERSFLCDRGANLMLTPSDVDAALATTTDRGPSPDAQHAQHLHLSGYTLLDDATRPAGRHALAAAAERGLTTSVDAASAAPLRRLTGGAFLEWVRGTDIVMANLDEARAMLGSAPATPEELARGLATAAASAAVIKLGADGAVWVGRDGAVVRADAVPAGKVADTIGAGDAFAAGLLTAWLAGEPPALALYAATRLGAEAVGVVGGGPPR